MLTQTELRALLLDANVEDVATRSGVSPKTIYRIRQFPDYSPTMETAEALVNALRVIATLAPGA